MRELRLRLKFAKKINRRIALSVDWEIKNCLEKKFIQEVQSTLTYQWIKVGLEKAWTTKVESVSIQSLFHPLSIAISKARITATNSAKKDDFQGTVSAKASKKLPLWSLNNSPQAAGRPLWLKAPLQLHLTQPKDEGCHMTLMMLGALRGLVVMLKAFRSLKSEMEIYDLALETRVVVSKCISTLWMVCLTLGLMLLNISLFRASHKLYKMKVDSAMRSMKHCVDLRVEQKIHQDSKFSGLTRS